MNLGRLWSFCRGLCDARLCFEAHVTSEGMWLHSSGRTSPGSKRPQARSPLATRFIGPAPGEATWHDDVRELHLWEHCYSAAPIWMSAVSALCSSSQGSQPCVFQQPFQTTHSSHSNFFDRAPDALCPLWPRTADHRSSTHRLPCWAAAEAGSSSKKAFTLGSRR